MSHHPVTRTHTMHPEEEFGYRAPSIEEQRTDEPTAVSTPADPEKALSTSATYVDLTAAAEIEKGKSSVSSSPGISPFNTIPVTVVEDALPVAAVDAKLAKFSDRPKLTQGRKYLLLFVFSLAMFIDIWCYSAFFIFTDPISKDLNILFEQQSWVITSYAVTFAAFLLFWGRVSDLYSAKPVFAYGFTALGVLNLVISFLPEKYSFFVFRAIAGIAGAALIPSSYRLIVYVFEEHELSMAFTVYGMSGALSNVSGTLIAGFISYIPGHGQMVAWRWFFRILAICVLPVAFLALRLVPRPAGNDADEDSKTKFKRLDIVGSAIMLFAITLLILGLTLGASYGWKKAGFLAPFLISWVLFPLFFIWEARLPEGYALIPPSTWRIPNFATWTAFATQVYPWWGVNFLALVETFTAVHGERAIIAAVRVLPQGIIAFCVVLLLTWKPQLVSRPRNTVALGMVFGIVGYVLMTRPTTFIGSEYWRYLFPAFVIGSGGMMLVFTSINVGVMTTVPAEQSGVAGAILQVAYQLGSAVGFSIQAGLLTVNPGSIANPDNVKASFYFQLGWCAVWLIGFLAFYRQPKQDVSSSEDGAEQGKRVVAAAH